MTTARHQPSAMPSRLEQKQRRYRIVAVTIFIFGVMFSLAIWQFTRQAISSTEKSQFKHYTEMIRTVIAERVGEHVAALRGLRAFIDSSELVTRAEWQTFVKDLDINQHFKGCGGFSFIRYLPRQDLEQFLAETRREVPDFAIATSGDNRELLVIDRIAPQEGNRRYIGYDLAQEETLLLALRKAASADTAVLSEPLGIIRDTAGRPGVLLLLPVYQNPAQLPPPDRPWQGVRGWVGAIILVGDMLAGIDAYFNAPLDIELLDITPGQKSAVLFDADGLLHSQRQNAASGGSGFEMESRTTLTVIDRTWALDVFALPGFSTPVSYYMPGALLAAGLLLSLFSSLQVASYGRPLARARQLAEQMTRELRASEERFHRLFQEHSAVMILVDPDSGIIVDANDAACRYYQYQREQLVNLPIGRINTMPGAASRETMQQIREKRRDHFEFRHILGSGEVRDVEVYSSPIEIEGKPLLFSIIHDISERKQAEQELDQYRENLESQVEKQTQKLQKAHAELLQRERLATLGKLTATVSHELRNPLGTIKTTLFTIADGLERNDPTAAARPLELAERSIDRCVAIIEELNSYTRVKQLSLTEATLDDWIREVVTEQTFPPDIHRELDLAGKTKVFLDREKLRQVIVNLISNALHALGEKEAAEKRLTIATRALDGWYEISVTDNGVGMSEETREKIFEPLYSTKGFGVGLGMVIVKNIVDQHHGEIRIDSTMGTGTTVTLRMPRTLPEEEGQRTT